MATFAAPFAFRRFRRDSPRPRRHLQALRQRNSLRVPQTLPHPFVLDRRHRLSRSCFISSSALPTAAQHFAGQDISKYLLAGYACSGIVSAALFGIGVGLASERSAGWLELKRASPMPPLTYLRRQVHHSAGVRRLRRGHPHGPQHRIRRRAPHPARSRPAACDSLCRRGPLSPPWACSSRCSFRQTPPPASST